MRRRLPLALTLVAALTALSASPGAASPRDALVVSTAWLAAHLDDPNLVLLHVGERAGYDQAHLPGARFVALQDISVSGTGEKGLVLEMPPADQLRERLASLGITDGSRIVVYYGKDWLSPTTRVIFTLDYAGLGDRVSMLDGGQDAWVRDGHPVTSEVPAPRAGSLSPLKIRPTVVDADYVRAHLKSPGVAIVDGRDREFYNGSRIPGREHKQRAGHIAGAYSIPFSQTTDDQMMLRSAGAMADLFSKAGVKPGDTVVAYCHIGQQATAVLFAARTLGHPVLLYDGSFEDWDRHPDYPVQTGDQP
jgi:thiosulfate/3-mercaptopyruvate sulfurtransferase